MTEPEPLFPPMVKNVSVPGETLLELVNLRAELGDQVIVRDANVKIPGKSITAIIGPSGSGKSMLLKIIAGLGPRDFPDVKVQGRILYGGKDIARRALGRNQTIVEPVDGMIYLPPHPIGFPLSIYENVVGPARLRYRSWGSPLGKRELDEICEKSLRRVMLWDEVKDRLSRSVFTVSSGQLQRICLARALALNANVLLLDEPTAHLDLRSKAFFEEVLDEQRETIAIFIVTHDMSQAARVSQSTMYLHEGDLREFDKTEVIFTRPKDPNLQDFITGRFS